MLGFRVITWCLGGNGGTDDCGHHYWRLYRGYYRDPFPHSLQSTREVSLGFGGFGCRVWDVVVECRT